MQARNNTRTVTIMQPNTYTEDQRRDAEKLMDVIEGVAPDKRPELFRLLEAMLMGAVIASQSGEDRTET